MNKYIDDLSTLNENKSHPKVSVGDTVKIVSYLELPVNPIFRKIY